jgi:spermidine synthase
MLALFFIAMGVLLEEIALTRVFSVMSWHHFAYLIISLALLGFGAASTHLSVAKRFSTAAFDPQQFVRYALGFAVTTILGFATATKVHFYPVDVYTYGDFSNIYSLALLYGIVGVPFFFAGVCIAYVISRGGSGIHRLYFADLIGAGTGALLGIAAINRLGAESTIYVAAACGALAAWLMAGDSSVRWRRAAFGVVALAALLAGFASRAQIFPVYFPPDKIFRLAMPPHFFEWHVVARVDVLDPVKAPIGFGGALSRAYTPSPDDEIELHGIYQDGGAMTGILKVPDGDVQRLPILGHYLQGAPYVVRPRAERAMVIGVGGGIDVLIALYNGCKQVVGVELNPVVVEVIQERYAEFAGGIFSRPDVELVNAEGRHYLTATQETFDVIQLSGVDTYTALASGAYALAENYLYTIEAMHDYWNHLTPDGILSFSRWLFTPPRETLRLVATEVEALRRLGIENVDRHLIVIRGQEKVGNVWAETLLKRSPFTAEEIAAYRAWAERLQFEILYDPFQPADNFFNTVIRATDAEREAFIRDYPYNIRPVTDDSPFFFDFYRWRALWSPRARTGEGGYYMTKFPLALMILLMSLVQILVLSVLFILGPLVPRGVALRGVAGKRYWFLYFACLGLAFILVEIVLLQKFTVFVGGPVYAMAVTLFSVLVFSGLGSFLGQRVMQRSSRRVVHVLVGIVIGIFVELAFVNTVVPRLMFLPHLARCAVTIVAIAPLALLMGMPFPTGLRLAQQLAGAVTPWAWGVNAVATTIGAVACVLASMQWGFTVSLVAGAVLYLGALATIRPILRLSDA